MKRRLGNLWRDDSGAISPLFAVAILPLIVMAGVAFDYSRLMAMDSELQNAADQAALAAATQLTGQTGAMDYAEQAARNYFVNETRAADGERPITQFSLTFYRAQFDNNGDLDKSSGALDPDDSDDDSLAKVVEVTIDARRARFALTPVMGRLFSGDVHAKATAMLDESTCNVAPMMFCAPDPGFGTDADRGRSIKLRMMPQDYKNIPEEYEFTPGNFGFLNIEYDTKGNPNRRLGVNSAGTCVGGAVETDPGAIETEADALNTRFDIFTQGLNNKSCDKSTGDFCASKNVRQNVVWPINGNSANCGANPGNAQLASRYDPAGFPIENCVKQGSCVAGAGDWDGASYMLTNHSKPLSVVGPNPTRFDIHNWELAQASSRLTPHRFNNPNYPGTGNEPQYLCSYPRPAPARSYDGPANGDKDRRVITVAVVDCTGMHGRDVAKVIRWTDLFLLTSADSFGSGATGTDKAFYAEVLGLARTADGSNGFQRFGRGKAVLIQ